MRYSSRYDGGSPADSYFEPPEDDMPEDHSGCVACGDVFHWNDLEDEICENCEGNGG